MTRKLTLIKRSIPKCVGCITMENSLEGEGIPFKTIDITDVPEAVEAFNISSIPTMIIEEDGVIVEVIAGNKSVEDIKKALGGI